MVKGETVMPVPEGNITTSDILNPVTLEDATELLKSQGEFLKKFTEEAEDDLPELS
jgi:hypothetical protein